MTAMRQRAALGTYSRRLVLAGDGRSRTRKANFRLVLLGGFMKLVLGLAACAITVAACRPEYGPEGIINSTLGSTEMTGCATIAPPSPSFNEVVERLATFARQHDMKFRNDLPNGVYRSYLQIDEPYVIVIHSFFSQGSPPTHRIITYRGASDELGSALETDLSENLAAAYRLDGCGEYRSQIPPGWSLNK